MKITIHIGDFEVVEVKDRMISIHIGRGIRSHFTLPFDHLVKVGDHLPLMTEVPICPPSQN